MLGEIRFDDFQPGVVGVLLKITTRATAEIVDHSNMASVREEAVDHVAADKSGSARNNIYAHASPTQRDPRPVKRPHSN